MHLHPPAKALRRPDQKGLFQESGHLLPHRPPFELVARGRTIEIVTSDAKRMQDVAAFLQGALRPEPWWRHRRPSNPRPLRPEPW
jgi:hypothetical protein